jgi:hypothetical protein
MYRSTLRAALFATVLSVGLASPVSAETPTGEYAIEGAGIASCSAYVEAKKAKSEAYPRFIGWLEGYLTAANRFSADTYDLTPWHSAELLGVVVEGHCEKNPQDRLFNIAQRLVISLTPDRMTQRSEMVRLTGRNSKGQERVVVVYTEVLRRAQDALKKQELYPGPVDGQYTPVLQRAFVNYQAAVGLDDTGLPDPLTLWLLFSPARTVATSSAR